MRLRTGIRENIDALTGLKENVIVDCLIPAGTGAGIGRLRVAAASRDAVRSVLQTEGSSKAPPIGGAMKGAWRATAAPFFV